MATYIASGIIVLIAVIHSVLGELGILRPLFAAPAWETPIPRFAVERILRFVWHLTSIAWVTLALVGIGWEVSVAVSVCCLASGLLIFVMLRGHLAWPLFWLAGGAALVGGDVVGDGWLDVVSVSAAGLAVAVAGVHVYWAAGGARWLSDAVPQREDGAPLFVPPRWMSFAVGVALVSFAGLVVCPVVGVEFKGLSWLLIAAVVVLGLRTIGDGRRVGFTKSSRSTRFARLDDQLYTPAVVLLCFGAIAAVAT